MHIALDQTWHQRLTVAAAAALTLAVVAGPEIATGIGALPRATSRDDPRAELTDLGRRALDGLPFAYQLEDLTIRGRMDRVDETPGGAIVVDYKSSEVTDQAKADEKARNSLQLQVYAMAHEAETGKPPAEVRLHFLDTGVVGTAKPDAARAARARQKLLRAAQGIRDREFAARPGAITCDYCPFRRICSSSAA